MRRTVAFTTALALTTMLWSPASLAAGDDEVAPPPQPPRAFCLHPIGAFVCLGIAIVAFGGCGNGFGCSGDDPGGRSSNPPDSSGGSGPPGPAGDGDGDHEGGSGGGDDDD